MTQCFDITFCFIEQTHPTSMSELVFSLFLLNRACNTGLSVLGEKECIILLTFIYILIVIKNMLQLYKIFNKTLNVEYVYCTIFRMLKRMLLYNSFNA